MKNIYDITREQLITMWIFGIIASLFLLEGSGPDLPILLTFLSIAFILVFYTLGWHRKNSDGTQPTNKN